MGMRQRPHLLVIAALLPLCSCTPLYIPPVPAPLELPERHEIDAAAQLDAGRPRLRIELLNVIEPVWLAVQWFSPANVEAASESVWVTPADEGSSFSLRLPDDVEADAGRWRALISADGRVLRQVSIEVP